MQTFLSVLLLNMIQYLYSVLQLILLVVVSNTTTTTTTTTTMTKCTPTNTCPIPVHGAPHVCWIDKPDLLRPTSDLSASRVTRHVTSYPGTHHTSKGEDEDDEL